MADNFNLLDANWTIMIISLILCLCSVILNSIEIYLIAKKWKKVTLFETILLNLAISDLLSSSTGITGTSLMAYYYLENVTYNYSIFAVFYVMSLLSVTTSTVFIVVIAIERLKAIKMPLKHRALHAGKTKTRRMIIFTWLGNVVLLAILLIMVFIVADFKPNTSTTYSQYTVGGYLCTGFLLTIVLYGWIAYLLLKRNSTFLAFDPKDKENKASIIKAVQKEKASIVACVLVVATFVGFNMPFAVTAFSGRVHTAAMVCTVANSVANPLVYFFKTYIERRFRNNKIKFDSNENRGGYGRKVNKGSTDVELDDISPEVNLNELEVGSKVNNKVDKDESNITL
eukprot:gene6869-7643_t